MRSQRHKLEQQGVTSGGYRGHERAVTVTGAAPTASAINMVPANFSGGTAARIKFLRVPSSAEGTLVYDGAGATPVPLNAWVVPTDGRFTQGSARGVFFYRYLLEHSDGNVYECVLKVSSTA